VRVATKLTNAEMSKCRCAVVEVIFPSAANSVQTFLCIATDALQVLPVPSLFDAKSLPPQLNNYMTTLGIVRLKELDLNKSDPMCGNGDPFDTNIPRWARNDSLYISFCLHWYPRRQSCLR